MPAPKSQNARRRGPRLQIPLDADVSAVRYYKCPKAAPVPAPKEKVVPKTHLRFIPPSLRRPSPWSEFLAEWLDSCEEKKQRDEEANSSCSSSTSGACSADTVTTDFSSVSSPTRKPFALTPGNRRIAPSPHPVPQQSQPSERYPFLVPPATSRGARLSHAQWAELLKLQLHSAQPKQQPPPPPLLHIHTAYLPELDAAVLEMMGQKKQRPSQQLQQQQRPFVPSHPWQQHPHYYESPGYPKKGASSVSSSCGTADSAHGGSTEGKTKSSQTCNYCYQFAVHEANCRPGSQLPRMTDKGYWRGHVLEQGNTIVCPRLLRRVCPLCGATGQSAHLTNYCPNTNKRISRY